MSKNNENKLVPKLRFPEFMDFGAWEIDEVGNVFDVTRGYVLAMNLVTEEQSENNPFPVYSSQTKNKGLAGYYKDYLYEDAITWTTDGANAGDVNFRKGKFYCTNVCGVLINKKGYSNHCVAALINSVSRKHVSYVGNPKLMNGVMSKIRIPFPKIPEQQKIADCLSSLDDVITAESQKLEVLKDHKKGLLQNLLPQAGETVPKFRFKEFEDSGEWVEKKLGDVSDVSKLAGYEFTKHIKYEDKGEIIALRGLNIKNNSLDLTDVKYIDNSELNMLGRSKLYIDDLMFTYIGTIGEVALIEENNRFYLAPNVSRIRANKKFVNSKFLLQYFNIPQFKDIEISKYISSSSQPALTMGNVRMFSILLPNLEEQQKIASTLSSIDELITAQTQKIEALQVHKKGLLQGLFPNINEQNG